MKEGYDKFHKNMKIKNRNVDVQISNSGAEKKNLVLIIQNLSFKAKEEDIQNFFKDFEIEKVMINRNEKGKSNGFAFIEFKNQNDMKMVLNMKEGILFKRKFVISKSNREITEKKNKLFLIQC